MRNPPPCKTHLSIMQGVIGRMAGNSASCKTWCITLVAAVLVVVARGGDPDYSLIALVPAILFLFWTPTTWPWSGVSAGHIMPS